MSDEIVVYEDGPVTVIETPGGQGPEGQKGDAGDSAYASAVSNGFIGTEQAWLASLKGDKGDTGQQGPQGIQGVQGVQGLTGPQGETGAAGPQGLQGDQGDSAYQVAVSEGFVGTNSQWLASLVGPQGVDGPQGEQGIQGPQGLIGPQGDKGDRGDSFSIDAVGPLIDRGLYDAQPDGFSFLADDTGDVYIRQGVTGWSEGIPFHGPKGDTGLTGPQGPQGLQGDAGPAGADATYSNAAPQPLGTTASPGVVTEASRADHVHPKPTTAEIGAEPAFAKNTAFNKNFGTTAGTVAEGNDARLSDSREWTAETVTQLEAEGGIATTRRAWTAQRVRQAIAAWWTTVSSTLEPAFTKNTGFNKNFGTTAGTVAAGDDARFHAHANKSTLDKITEDADLPLWNGGEWPGAGGETWELLHIQDRKTNNTHGGTLTTGTRNIRILNTVVTNEITGASLATNQITLPAGEYVIETSAPAYGVVSHQTTLYSVTASANVLIGTTEFSNATNPSQTRSYVVGKITIAANTVYELSHYTSTSISNVGAGTRGGLGLGEVYADVKIWRRVTA